MQNTQPHPPPLPGTSSSIMHQKASAAPSPGPARRQILKYLDKYGLVIPPCFLPPGLPTTTAGGRGGVQNDSRRNPVTPLVRPSDGISTSSSSCGLVKQPMRQHGPPNSSRAGMSITISPGNVLKRQSTGQCVAQTHDQPSASVHTQSNPIKQDNYKLPGGTNTLLRKADSITSALDNSNATNSDIGPVVQPSLNTSSNLAGSSREHETIDSENHPEPQSSMARSNESTSVPPATCSTATGLIAPSEPAPDSSTEQTLALSSAGDSSVSRDVRHDVLQAEPASEQLADVARAHTLEDTARHEQIQDRLEQLAMPEKSVKASPKKRKRTTNAKLRRADRRIRKLNLLFRMSHAFLRIDRKRRRRQALLAARSGKKVPGPGRGRLVARIKIFRKVPDASVDSSAAGKWEELATYSYGLK